MDGGEVSIFRIVVRGAWGNYVEWAAACRTALLAGWSMGKVEAVLWTCGPMAIVWVTAVVLLVAVGVSRLVQ